MSYSSHFAMTSVKNRAKKRSEGLALHYHLASTHQKRVCQLFLKTWEMTNVSIVRDGGLKSLPLPNVTQSKICEHTYRHQRSLYSWTAVTPRSGTANAPWPSSPTANRRARSRASFSKIIVSVQPQAIFANLASYRGDERGGDLLRWVRLKSTRIRRSSMIIPFAASLAYKSKWSCWIS